MAHRLNAAAIKVLAEQITHHDQIWDDPELRLWRALEKVTPELTEAIEAAWREHHPDFAAWFCEQAAGADVAV